MDRSGHAPSFSDLEVFTWDVGSEVVEDSDVGSVGSYGGILDDLLGDLDRRLFG